MRSQFLAAALIAATALPGSALAWGRTGHAVVADIARGYLTPKAAAAVDAKMDKHSRSHAR